MNAIACYSILVLVAIATGTAGQSGESGNGRSDVRKLIDPWKPERDLCRRITGLSREELKDATDLRTIDYYLLCLFRKLHNLHFNGTIDTTNFIANIRNLSPTAIGQPIMNCCIKRVYKDQIPEYYEIAPLLADFLTCYKSLIPDYMWNIIGIQEPPVYPILTSCLQ